MSNGSKTELLATINWGRFRTAAIICIGMLSLYIALLFGAAFVMGAENVLCFMAYYFRGLVGIPSCVIMATTIVAFLASAVSGDFKVKALGAEFEGPSAPITMWVVCFIVLATSVAFLFPEVKSIGDLPERLGQYCAAPANAAVERDAPPKSVAPRPSP